jgi:hypothetical protein
LRLLTAILLILTGSCSRRPEKKTGNAKVPATDVVASAKEVASVRFPDFTYGHRIDKKQIDCVQFMGAVTESLLHRPLTREETDALFIRYDFKDLDEAVASEDPRTRGIQRALAEVIRRGTVVEMPHVQRGDFVQYWILGKDGKWMGHSALVTRVLTDGQGPAAIAIYGSNKSTGGIAETDFGGGGVSLRKPGRKFYFVRFDSNLGPAPVP